MSTQNNSDGHRQEGGAVIEMYAGVGVQNGQAALSISVGGYIIEEGGAKCLDLVVVHKMDDKAIMEASRAHAGETRWSVTAPKREFKCDCRKPGRKPIVLTLNCVRGEQPYAVIRDAHGGTTDNGNAPAGSTLPVSAETRQYVLSELNRYAGYDMFMPLHPAAARKVLDSVKAAERERRRAKRVAKAKAEAKAKAKAEAVASGKRVVQFKEGKRTHVRKVMLYDKDGHKVDTTERWGWQEVEKKAVRTARKCWQSPANHHTRHMVKREGNVALAFTEACI